MVTAKSVGPCLSADRQRAARNRSAVESGPPETASTRAAACVRSANSASACVTETGDVSSAFDTLLFPLDPLLHGDRGARVSTADLAQGGAGRFLLVERRQRLAEPQQRI